MSDETHNMTGDEEGLGQVLERIPGKWGRWIDVDRGWYPLVIATDYKLAQVDSNYVIHQIKEKYGTLRYYCAPSGDDPSPEIIDKFDAITEAAEHESAQICEQCSDPGTLRQIKFLVKTLCAGCADNLH